jgi:hypothetical protein
MTFLPVTSALTANTCGFIAKQTFCYNGIEFVRNELHKLITTLTADSFGAFTASLIGAQASIMFSVPVTCLLSDMIFSAVKESVQAVIRLSTSFFQTPPKTKTPLFREFTTKVVSYVAYFFSKTYFCNYCMPLVKTGLEASIRCFIKLSCSPLPAPFFISTFAYLAAPAATFLAGDLVGILSAEVANKTLSTFNENNLLV